MFATYVIKTYLDDMTDDMIRKPKKIDYMSVGKKYFAHIIDIYENSELTELIGICK